MINSSRKLIVIVVIISILVGGIAGGILGFFAERIVPGPVQKFLEKITASRQAPGEAKREVIEERVIQEIVKIEEEATISAVEKVSPSVVSIIISKDLSKYYSYTGPGVSPYDDYFEFDQPFEFEQEFFQPGSGKQEIGGGTGFIISSDGLILTNKHVVYDEEAEYTVITNEGQSYPAEVLATDPFIDVAIIRIEAEDLPVVELGDSDNLRMGQTVIAIGNALGEYRNTITRGIVSGVGRTVVATSGWGRSEVLEDVIQTDAAINLGNSGGPLLNLRGEVIGINTAVSQQGQLIGFAIPINAAKQSIESVKKYGRIVRPFLGVRYVLINETIAKEKNLSVDYGALIVRGSQLGELAIIPDGPADKAGIVGNDIILEVDGQRVDQKHNLAKIIGQHNPGDEVTLKILHKGEEKIIKVTLEEFEG